VDATSTLFRVSKGEERRPLLSLEYLVSKLTVFEVTEPRDCIYSLLAIARDTEPMANVNVTRSPTLANRILGEMFCSGNRVAKPYNVEYQKDFIDICKEFTLFSIYQSDRTRALDIICRPWAPPPESKKNGKKEGRRTLRLEDGKEKMETLPSWIPNLDGAAHEMFTHPDNEVRMGRINADPLVGLPDLSKRNYNAAGGKKIDMSKLRFKKREKHHSMFVSGFIIDKVAEVGVASQAGNIPKEWITLGGWEDTSDEPPEDFWRTLVADRGKDGRNPPTYYARACKESITKGLQSGSLNTTVLINNGRCSVVSEFFRRVQAVIWNRSLMRTKGGKLGIVRKDVRKDDLICNLYGCSVPVILQQKRKANLAEEKHADAEFLKQFEEKAIWMQRRFKEKFADKLENKRIEKEKEKEFKRIVEEKLARSKERAAKKREANQTDGEGPLPTQRKSSATVTGTDTPQTEIATDSGLKPDLQGEPNGTAPSGNGDDSNAGLDPEEFYYEFIGECYIHGDDGRRRHHDAKRREDKDPGFRNQMRVSQIKNPFIGIQA
jgi:hypothetical protein